MSTRIILNRNEIYVLELIAARSRMDCWFSIYTLNENKYGTRVKDLERGRLVSLRSGVKSFKKVETLGGIGK